MTALSSLALQFSRLLKRLGACHSERSEESELLIVKQSEMLRFAQHDSCSGFFSNLPEITGFSRRPLSHALFGRSLYT